MQASTMKIVASVALAISAHAVPADSKINRGALQTGEGFDRIIVHFDAQTRGRPNAVLGVVGEVAQGQGIGLNIIRQLAIGAHVIEVEQRIPAAATEALMRAFARRAVVEYVEPDALMQASLTPDDDYYSAQWHYSDPVSGMNLPSAWDIANGLGEVVAVLDSGQTNHEDLVGNMVAGYDFISDTYLSRDGDLRDADPSDEGNWRSSSDCYEGSPPRDSSWHGTHVAGTVAAVTDNRTGVAGVAFGAKVQHVRVLGRCGGYLSDIADAIIWASGGSVPDVTDNSTPASVINMSLGGDGECGSTYQSAINEAVANGATVVVAAGNGNADASGFRPANCDKVITVAASGETGARAGYSNYGSLVEITAPGGDFSVGNGVLSTLNDGVTIPGNDTYAYYQGTSMATPHISGLVAMMLDVDSSLTPEEISLLIQDNARPLPGGCPEGCGAGLADAEATLLAIIGGPARDNDSPEARISFACAGFRCNFTDNSRDSDGFIAFWHWDFGDGGMSTAQSPTHAFSPDGGAGTFPVILTVTDDDGASDSVSVDVNVTEPTVSSFANFAQTCTHLSCEFMDHSSNSDGGITSWHWDFGDDDESFEQSPSHTYAAGGAYIVTLKVTHVSGASDSTSSSVTVAAPARSSGLGASFSGLCMNLSCQFTSHGPNSNDGIVSWSWDFGDGGASTAKSPGHTYVAGGTYFVTLTVTGASGATDRVTGSVTVTELAHWGDPEASFTWSCTNLACDFIDDSQGSAGGVSSWRWDFGDGGASTEKNPSHTYESADTYLVTLRVTLESGATDSVSHSVTVTAAGTSSLPTRRRPSSGPART